MSTAVCSNRSNTNRRTDDASPGRGTRRRPIKTSHDAHRCRANAANGHGADRCQGRPIVPGGLEYAGQIGGERIPQRLPSTSLSHVTHSGNPPARWLIEPAEVVFDPSVHAARPGGDQRGPQSATGALALTSSRASARMAAAAGQAVAAMLIRPSFPSVRPRLASRHRSRSEPPHIAI